MPNVEHRQESRVEGYTKYWNKDSAKDTEEDKSKRLAEYTEVVNGPSVFVRMMSSVDLHKVTTMVLPSCTSTAGLR